MKRIVAILLIFVMIFSFAGCGAKNPTASSAASTIPSALTLLETVWAAHSEDQKFPIAGGDFTSGVFDAPAAFSLEDADSLDSMLAVDSTSVDKIQEAASMMHMMNANTFTCGAFKMKDAGSLEAFSHQMRDNIQGRMWMCGFPDKLVVASVEDYVIAMFGDQEIVNTFVKHMQEAYSAVNIVFDEEIM